MTAITVNGDRDHNFEKSSPMLRNRPVKASMTTEETKVPTSNYRQVILISFYIIIIKQLTLIIYMP